VRRAFITGIGAVSPFVGRERFWDHVSRGCSGTRAITDFDATEFSCRVAAPVSNVALDDVPLIGGDDIWDEAYRADPKRYSRAALVGVIAGREAWIDAGLRIGEPNAGVIVGSGGGGIDVASGSTTISSSNAAARSRRTRFRCPSSAWCRARFRFRCGCAASATCCRAGARARATPSAMRRRSFAPARRTSSCQGAQTRA
jgi:3-oxoacyl-(acyl-carrier-protein) synthase